MKQSGITWNGVPSYCILVNNRHETHGLEFQPDVRIQATKISEWMNGYPRIEKTNRITSKTDSTNMSLQSVKRMVSWFPG